MVGVLVLAVLLFVVFESGIYRSQKEITCNYIEVDHAQISHTIRLVILSDLHDHLFGDENAELTDRIQALQPDMICMVGDMLNKDSDDAEVPTALIRRLSEVAPVYYALGNHELKWQEVHGKELQKDLESAGAVLLEKSWLDLELYGQQIRIGGMYAYAFDLQKEDLTETQIEARDFLTAYQDTDSVKILLAHRPDSYAFGDASISWNIDYVISGHLHGGQVVLPFLGGMYGADQGWFPKYVHGLYQKDQINLLVTSGLSSNESLIPRWNNPAEIMILDIG